MKKDNVKLLFFSETIPEKMYTETCRVLMLLQSERITFSRAESMLHQAGKDLETIYQTGSMQIAAAESAVAGLRKNGRFNRSQLDTENILSLQTKRAIVSMRAGIESFRGGTITKRQLCRQAKEMKTLLNQDVLILNQEIRQLISNLSESDRVEKGPVDDWREAAKDMLVEKVSRDDDLA